VSLSPTGASFRHVCDTLSPTGAGVWHVCDTHSTHVWQLKQVSQKKLLEHNKAYIWK